MALPPEEKKASSGKIVKAELKSFLATGGGRELREKYDADLDKGLRAFLEGVYIHHDTAPKDLSVSEFREVVMDTLPRCFSGEESFLDKVPDMVGGYLEYLIREDALETPADYRAVIDEMKKKFVKAVKKVKPADRLLSDEARKQIHREGGKVGRNDPCPCGSGKKYKKCCGQSA